MSEIKNEINPKKNNIKEGIFLKSFNFLKDIYLMNLKYHIFILPLILFSSTCFADLSDSNICLVKNNNTDTAVIIPNKAIPCEKLAAEELQYHIEKATKVKIPICEEKETPASFKHLIYIGNCDKTAEAGINTALLSPSEYVIKTIGKNLFIAGRDRDTAGRIGDAWLASWQGTLFGVYDLLENELGVRWLWPGELGEFVPKAKEVSLGNIDRGGKPNLIYANLKEAGKKPYIKQGWALQKNKEMFLKDQSRFLLRHRFSSVQNMNYCHNFANYWERFGKSHPEYFPLLPNGKREPLAGDPTGEIISFCVSEPALWKQILKDWKNKIWKDNIKMTFLQPYVNACINDGPVMCTCEKCRSWDADDPKFAASDYWGKGIIPDRTHRWTLARADWGEGVEQPSWENVVSVSDRVANFYLHLLNEAKKEKPDAKVIGYAYSNYVNPPKNIKLNEDIIIINVFPLWFPYTEENSRAFRENWMGWRNTGAVLQFRPNLLHAGANLPIFYAKQFVKDFSFAFKNGMTASSHDSLRGAWSTQGPTLYAVARVHEHPDWSADKILDEYYSGFGKAKSAVKKYFEYWEKYSDSIDEKAVRKYCFEEKDSLGNPAGSFKNYVRIAHRLFTPEAFSNARKLINEALESAKGDTLAEQRVSFLEKGLTDAELTTETRAAQSKMEKTPSNENSKAFETAFKKLADYRAGIENDNVCDFGCIAFREKTGSKWPWKETKE